MTPRNRNLPSLGGEVAGGNMYAQKDVEARNIWQQELKKLAFTSDEIATILASNDLYNLKKEIEAKGKTMSPKDERMFYKVFFENLKKD